MARAATGTRTQVERLQALDAKAADLPRKGHHVGGGRHVAMTDDPSSPGWTRYVHSVMKHPDRDKWAYPITTLDRADLSKLSGAERAEVAQARAATKELSTDWNPKVELPSLLIPVIGKTS